MALAAGGTCPVPPASRPLPGAQPRSVYSDLDGTLIGTNTLLESLLVLLRTRPLVLLVLPFWLLRGWAHAKREVAKRVHLDPSALPFRESVVDYLRAQRSAGRSIILATSADATIAEAVADHLGLFDGVLASNGRTHLLGPHKLRAIQSHAAGHGFDYLGTGRANLPIWREAGRALVVAPTASVLKHVRASCREFEVICTRDRSGRDRLKDLLRTLRVHQWAKNVLLFVPLVLSHHFAHPASVLAAVVGFISFSFCASGLYVLNDLFDLHADRAHPNKRHRPLAAGRIGVGTGLWIAPALLLVGLSLAVGLLPPAFTGMIVLYLGLALAYSLRAKEMLALDVILLAGFFTIRVLAGGAAIRVPISPWLQGFSIFFFLSLALLKRYTDLVRRHRSGRGHRGRRAYGFDDADMIRDMGPASGFISVLVMALYIHSPEVALHYVRPALLWLILPCLLYWLSRAWFLAHRGQLPYDPILFALRDRNSYLVAALIILVMAAAMWPG
jgi:4-hydroxybenzoate polyprenyltransferase